jgi:hypothetical protein
MIPMSSTAQHQPVVTKNLHLAAVLQSGGASVTSITRDGVFYRVTLDMAEFDARQLAADFRRVADTIERLGPESGSAAYERASNTTVLAAIDKLLQDTKQRGAADAPGGRR